MLLFSFLLFPLLITLFCLVYKNAKITTVILTGVFSAILVCACKFFFTFSHRIIPYSFGENFVFLFFTQSFLPVIILYAVFFLISKDDKDFKCKSFLPLEFSFYAVFLPYIIVTTSEGLYSWYSLFYKPLIFAAMLLQLYILLKIMIKGIESKKIFLIVISIFAILIYLPLPAVFESLYLIKSHTFLVIFGGLVYILLPLIILVLSKKLARSDI